MTLLSIFGNSLRTHELIDSCLWRIPSLPSELKPRASGLLRIRIHFRPRRPSANTPDIDSPPIIYQTQPGSYLYMVLVRLAMKVVIKSSILMSIQPGRPRLIQTGFCSLLTSFSYRLQHFLCFFDCGEQRRKRFQTRMPRRLSCWIDGKAPSDGT